MFSQYCMQKGRTAMKCVFCLIVIRLSGQSDHPGSYKRQVHPIRCWVYHLSTSPRNEQTGNKKQFQPFIVICGGQIPDLQHNLFAVWFVAAADVRFWAEHSIQTIEFLCVMPFAAPSCTIPCHFAIRYFAISKWPFEQHLSPSPLCPTPHFPFLFQRLAQGDAVCYWINKINIHRCALHCLLSISIFENRNIPQNFHFHAWPLNVISSAQWRLFFFSPSFLRSYHIK